MDNKYQRNIKARIAGGVAAVGLAACCMAVPAFAADGDHTGTTGTTEVTVSIDASQIAWSAPTKIPFAAEADGTLVGPSAEAAQITNDSIFPIHVTNMAVAEKAPFHLASDVSSASEENSFQFALNGAQAAASVDLSGSTWNMGAKGSANASIGLGTTNAKIANLTADLTQAPTAATITWTVAAGASK